MAASISLIGQERMDYFESMIGDPADHHKQVLKRLVSAGFVVSCLSRVVDALSANTRASPSMKVPAVGTDQGSPGALQLAATLLFTCHLPAGIYTVYNL